MNRILLLNIVAFLCAIASYSQNNQEVLIQKILEAGLDHEHRLLRQKELPKNIELLEKLYNKLSDRDIDIEIALNEGYRILSIISKKNYRKRKIDDSNAPELDSLKNIWVNSEKKKKSYLNKLLQADSLPVEGIRSVIYSYGNAEDRLKFKKLLFSKSDSQEDKLIYLNSLKRLKKYNEINTSCNGLAKEDPVNNYQSLKFCFEVLHKKEMVKEKNSLFKQVKKQLRKDSKGTKKFKDMLEEIDSKSEEKGY